MKDVTAAEQSARVSRSSSPRVMYANGKLDETTSRTVE